MKKKIKEKPPRSPEQIKRAAYLKGYRAGLRFPTRRIVTEPETFAILPKSRGRWIPFVPGKIAPVFGVLFSNGFTWDRLDGWRQSYEPERIADIRDAWKTRKRTRGIEL